MPLAKSRVAIFVANRPYAILSSRRELLSHFMDQGWKVVVVTKNDDLSDEIKNMGFVHEPVNFTRGGVGLISDVAAFFKLCLIYNKYSPDLIQHFHAKPVILGSIAARFVLRKKVQVVSTITGLGHAFIKSGFIASLAGFGYKIALGAYSYVVFQNHDDQVLFLQKKWVDRDRQRLIIGSGIDLSRFAYVDRFVAQRPEIVVVMLGRVLMQKGLLEFSGVAESVEDSGARAKFIWAGEIDLDHPDSVDEKWFSENRHIEYVGRLDDVAPLLHNSDILLFPSYREGVPRAVMEASASGVPTVAFDVPGVREVVRDGVTGYLVPFGDIEALSQRVKHLLENSDLRREMGGKAREMAERHFDTRVIQGDYVKTYQSIGIDIATFSTGRGSS